MGLFDWIGGWRRIPESKIPKWLSKTKKIQRAHHFATHRQNPGTTAIYHLKGKNYVYRIKIKSMGQYAKHKVFSKRLKK